MRYMKTISSAEFRKTYQRLEEEVEVTANGHAIGVWRPITTLLAVERDTGDPTTRVAYIEGRYRGPYEEYGVSPTPTPFLRPAIDRAMREFRPVPKPGKK